MRFDGLVQLRRSHFIFEGYLIGHQMVVHLRILLQSLVAYIIQPFIRLAVQSTLKEENLLGLLVSELLLLTTIVRILLAPYFFFLVQDLCRIVPLDPVIVLGLVLLNALHEAHVVDVETIANSIASLTILILFCINRVHNHFAVLRRRTSEHSDWILGYILQSLLSQIIQPLRHSQIRMLLNYANKPVQIVERYQSVLVLVNVS